MSHENPFGIFVLIYTAFSWLIFFAAVAFVAWMAVGLYRASRSGWPKQNKRRRSMPVIDERNWQRRDSEANKP